MMGIFCLRQVAFDDVQVGAADGAAAHPNPHFARRRLGDGQFGQFQGCGIDRRDLAKEHGFHGQLRGNLITTKRPDNGPPAGRNVWQVFLPLPII